MKKLILIVMLLFYISVFAYEKGIGGYVEFGQSLEPVETHTMTTFGKSENYSNYIAYTDINLHYVFQINNIQIVPFTSIKTWMISSNTILKNKPFCDIYTLGIETKYKGVSFIIDHYCAHSVYSNYEMWQVKDYRMGQNMTEAKLRYSFN